MWPVTPTALMYGYQQQGSDVQAEYSGLNPGQ
jgi:hypothetical protein